jgi:SSS family transporter
VYLLLSIAIGSAAGKGARTGTSYFLADRSVHWFPAGITMTAVSISTITFIGMPGQAFQSDWTLIQVYLSIPIAAVIVCKYFLPRYTSARVATAYEFLERRFDRKTRLYASVVFLLILCGSTGIAVYAPAILLSEMSNLSVPWSILFVALFTAAYTVAGGVKGVIYTDLLQAAVLLGGWAVATIYILQALPHGAGQFWSDAAQSGKLKAVDLSFGTPVNLWAGMIGMLFTHVALAGVNQSQVQKYLSVSTLSAGRRAILLHGVMLIVIYIAFFALGTMLFIFYNSGAAHLPPDTPGDRVFPFFIVHELPAGIRGFLAAGAFAAAMSTISSGLNTLANVTVVDLLERWGPGVRTARIVTVAWTLVVIGAAVIAFRLGSLLELIVRVNSYFYGCLLGIFLLGMFNERASGAGVRGGLLTGMAGIIALALWRPELWAWFGLVGCVTTVSTGYLLSAMTGARRFDADGRVRSDPA